MQFTQKRAHSDEGAGRLKDEYCLTECEEGKGIF